MTFRSEGPRGTSSYRSRRVLDTKRQILQSLQIKFSYPLPHMDAWLLLFSAMVDPSPATETRCPSNSDIPNMLRWTTFHKVHQKTIKFLNAPSESRHLEQIISNRCNKIFCAEEYKFLVSLSYFGMFSLKSLLWGINMKAMEGEEMDTKCKGVARITNSSS